MVSIWGFTPDCVCLLQYCSNKSLILSESQPRASVLRLPPPGLSPVFLWWYWLTRGEWLGSGVHCVPSRPRIFILVFGHSCGDPLSTVRVWVMSHKVFVIKRHWCCVLNHTGSQILVLYLHISRILVLYSICSLQLYHSDFIFLWLRGTGVVYSITMVLHTVIKRHWCCVLNHTGSKILVLHLHISIE